MDFYQTSHKIQMNLRGARHVLVATHQKPDPDAVGSLAAVSNLLQSMQVRHTLYCPHRPDEHLAWLLDYREIKNNIADIVDTTYDFLVVVDCGDLRHPALDVVLPQLPSRPQIINIDHHHTNTAFGDINLVDPFAVSTTEIIFRMMEATEFPVDTKTANALLAGIFGDTYSFTNNNTTHRSMKIVSDLLRAGASMPQVSGAILKNKSVETLHAWGDILQHLQYNKKYGIATTVIEPKDPLSNASEADSAEGIATFLNNLGGVQAALVLAQEPGGIIKGSLRTNRDDIDVSALAKVFGGGGHKKASGFRIKGTLVKEKNSRWKII